jgi:hypothetical protein
MCRRLLTTPSSHSNGCSQSAWAMAAASPSTRYARSLHAPDFQGFWSSSDGVLSGTELLVAPRLRAERFDASAFY